MLLITIGLYRIMVFLSCYLLVSDVHAKRSNPREVYCAQHVKHKTLLGFTCLLCIIYLGNNIESAWQLASLSVYRSVCSFSFFFFLKSYKRIPKGSSWLNTLIWCLMVIHIAKPLILSQTKHN